MNCGRRRALRLAGGCLVGITSAGCLSGPTPETFEPSETEPPDPDYDKCHRTKIPYGDLPEEVRTEVDAALEDGEYRAASLLIDDAIDVPEAYLVVRGTPYDPRVEDGDSGAKVLTLTEVDAVRRSRPRTLLIRNTDDREHEVRVEVVGEETVLRKHFTLKPDDFRKFSVTDEFGNYDLIVETPNSDKETLREGFVVDDLYEENTEVEITDKNIDTTQQVVDRAPCTWEE